MEKKFNPPLARWRIFDYFLARDILKLARLPGRTPHRTSILVYTKKGNLVFALVVSFQSEPGGEQRALATQEERINKELAQTPQRAELRRGISLCKKHISCW
jgi:hypothetical protein